MAQRPEPSTGRAVLTSLAALWTVTSEIVDPSIEKEEKIKNLYKLQSILRIKLIPLPPGWNKPCSFFHWLPNWKWPVIKLMTKVDSSAQRGNSGQVNILPPAGSFCLSWLSLIPNLLTTKENPDMRRQTWNKCPRGVICFQRRWIVHDSPPIRRDLPRVGWG